MATGPGFPVLSAAVLVDFGRTHAGDPRIRPLTILLAGTAAADTVQLREGLEEAGHRCLLAADWKEAMGIVSRTPIDIMVQELACPGARRFEGVKVLRGWPPPISRLIILALSGEREPRLEAACREAGFDALVSRPVPAEVLEAALRRLVVAHSPAEPLDPVHRAALLEELGAEALRARDEAVLDEAAACIADIRSLPALPDVQAAAARAAEVLASIGAIAAAAAARAVEAEPGRRPALLQPLVSATIAAKMALRRG